MKKFVLPLLLFLCIQNLSYGFAIMPSSVEIICTSDYKTCKVGKTRISDGKGLLFHKGFVCTHNGSMCTNGHYSSYGGIEILDRVVNSWMIY